MDWNEYFIDMADFVATKSKDKSRKVGCVIVGEGNEVLSTGYNGFPRGVDDTIPERDERPAKYDWTEHAERNACYNAARAGIRLLGATAYMASPPCTECARALIQSGIAKVVSKKNNLFTGSSWDESIAFGRKMMEEAGVEVEIVED